MIGAIILQIVLIALNAVFAAAEIAVISMNDAKLKRLVAEGDRRAARLAVLTEQPSRFLATIQVAITLAGLLSGAFAADNFADPLVELLVGIGIIDEPLSMLYTEFSVLIGTIYLFLPTMIMTLVGVMDQIDNDMMEAAESLGASRLKAFFRIVLPMSIPGILTGAVLVFTGALTAYTTPQLLGGNSSLVLATLIYQRAMTLNDWTGAGVIAAVMIVITLIVMKVLNFIAARLDKRGEVNA